MASFAPALDDERAGMIAPSRDGTTRRAAAGASAEKPPQRLSAPVSWGVLPRVENV